MAHAAAGKFGQHLVGLGSVAGAVVAALFVRSSSPLVLGG